jgi:hypothetical protein
VGLTYGLDVQTAWIKLTGLQGYQSVRRLQVLGEYRSAHDLRIRVARDYRTDYTDDKSWTATPTEVGGPEQVRHGPSFRKCQAIKVRITATAVGSDSPPTGEAVKLTGLGLEVGARKGLRRLPAAQSQ